MTLNEYQLKAMSTCMSASWNFSYMMLNLMGEVGEFAGKIAKHIRKDEVYIGTSYKDADGNTQSTSHINTDRLTEEQKLLLFKEMGDIMWQVAGLAHVMGWSLEDICQHNLLKLQDRKQRHVIDGNGDER